MSPAAVAEHLGLASFPRVSGDEPLIDLTHADQEGFSPRERG